ncbi:MAG: hypothetical protein IT461_01675 [Planctomycetes bacterium]|nr:hypothetical protein [Planctomycetota bacterium]
MRTIFCVAALLMLAASVQSQDKPAARKAVLPWDVAAVKAAWAWGLVLTFDHEQTGKPSERVRFEFAEEGQDGLSKLRTLISAKGEESADKPKYLTWEQHLESLTEHFGAAAATDEELKLGETTYSCRCLTAPADEATGVLKRRAWFCADVAGMWVKYEIERKDGVETWRMNARDTVYHDAGWRLSEIAPALKKGATFKYRYIDERGIASTFALTISEGNDEGFKEVITYFDRAGKQEGESVSSRVLWSRYEKGFLFAKSEYQLTTSTLEYAGQKLECSLLTFSEARGDAARVVITTLSRKHPGMIVARHTSIKSKEMTLSTRIELQEFKIGS